MEISLKNKINKARKLIDEKYKDSCHKERYLHILGVADMAKRLATLYNVNEEKAYIAGLMHDYYKYEPKEEMQILLTSEEKKEAEECNVLYHSYASARAYKKLIDDDDEVFSAIKNHVFGHLNMTKLEEIILISDYIEENRKYPNCIFCRSLVNRGFFYTAIYESTRHTISFIESKGQKPAIMQVSVLQQYKELMFMELLNKIKEALDKVKASDIIVYDMKEKSPFYDYFVLATVSSLRQAGAVKSYIEELILDTPFKIRSVEGEDTEWVLIDCYDIIISVFTKEERERLEFEKIYMDVPQLKI